MPIEWREVYAVAAYACVRPEELQALTRKDLDLEAGVLQVSKAIDAALAGVPLSAMKRRAGHKDLETTLGYVKMAEDLGGKLGVPFGPLPPSLVAPLPATA